MNQVLPTAPFQHAGLRLRPITVDDFLRMIEAGILTSQDRVELIEGQLVEMGPIGNPHIETVNRLTKTLVLAVGDLAVVSIQNSVDLDDKTRRSLSKPCRALRSQSATACRS